MTWLRENFRGNEVMQPAHGRQLTPSFCVLASGWWRRYGSSRWAPTHMPGDGLDVCTLNHLMILIIILQCKSFTSLSYRWEDWIQGGQVVCSKPHSPDRQSLIFPSGWVWILHNLLTCHYISSRGRSFHHIPAYNCFQEAAEKGLIIFGLGKGKFFIGYLQ